MAQQDRMGDGQPTDGASSQDGVGADAAHDGATERADDTDLTATSAVSDETSGASAGTRDDTPVATRPNASARQRLINDPVLKVAAQVAKSQALFEAANSPAVRMATEAARNAARFELPSIQPPMLTLLNDPAFHKAVQTFITSYKLPAASAVARLRENSQWLQLTQPTPIAQQLLAGKQTALLDGALRQHAEFLTSIIESTTRFRDIVESVSESLRFFRWQQLFPNLKQLKKTLRTSLLTSFIYADLWPAPSMPIELLDKISQLTHGDDRRPVVLAVWNHYARHDHAALAQAIAAWGDDPEYAARQHIFAQALQGHRVKLYALTIPTLLAQVEGIAGDFVHAGAQTGPAPKLGKSGPVVQHALKVAGYTGITDEDDAEVLHAVLVEAVIEHVQHVSFENSDFAAQYTTLRQRRTLNRHGTLHGIQINYPSAMNSLRCFLLLDALYALRKHARETAATSAASATA